MSIPDMLLVLAAAMVAFLLCVTPDEPWQGAGYATAALLLVTSIGVHIVEGRRTRDRVRRHR